MKLSPLQKAIKKPLVGGHQGGGREREGEILFLLRFLRQEVGDVFAEG